MLFIRSATTPGMRAACFPGAAEDADPAGLTRAALLRAVVADHAVVVGSAAVAWVAPSPAAGQTAAAMGLEPRVVTALAQVDCGRWGGLPYARVAEEEPAAMTQWLTDPEAVPHGGESLAALTARVATWLGTVRHDGVVVCDAAVIRAALGWALGLGPPAANRFDLAPLSTTELTPARDGWRVAHVNRKVMS